MGGNTGFQLLQSPAAERRPVFGPNSAVHHLCPGVSLSAALVLLPHLYKGQALQQAARKTGQLQLLFQKLSQ